MKELQISYFSPTKYKKIEAIDLLNTDLKSNLDYKSCNKINSYLNDYFFKLKEIKKIDKLLQYQFAEMVMKRQILLIDNDLKIPYKDLLKNITIAIYRNFLRDLND